MSLEYYTRNLDQLGYPGQTGTPRNAVIDVEFSDEAVTIDNPGGIETLVYTATGGEDSFQNDVLIESTIISVTRDGLEYTPVTSFSATTKKEFIHDEETGEITYHTGLPTMEPDEDNVVTYIVAGSATPTSEPVTLAQAKAWLRVTRDDENAIIAALITAARRICEAKVNKSFVPRTVTAILRNDLGNIKLPYGPVNTVTSVSDSEDVALSSSDYNVSGIGDKRLGYPMWEYVKVVYTAGYSALPENFKTAIKMQLAWMYTHRGDEEINISQLSNDAKAILSPYMINKV